MKTKFKLLLLLLAVPLFTLATDSYVEVYFTKDVDPSVIIKEKIDNAQKYVNIAMYYFTDQYLGEALKDAYERGVEVKVFLDKSQAERSAYASQMLVTKKIPVKISSNNYIMHNKFAVIDGDILLNGSYNWTVNAKEHNDENLLLIRDSSVVNQFNRKFERFWAYEIDTILTNELYRFAKQVFDYTRDIPDIEKGELKVVELHYDGSPKWDEWVVFENASDKIINIGGCKIKDDATHEFILKNTEVSPGRRVTIHNYSDKSISLDVRIPIWNNEGDTLYLYNRSNELILKYGY